jgi:hypothetical protein
MASGEKALVMATARERLKAINLRLEVLRVELEMVMVEMKALQSQLRVNAAPQEGE